MDNKKKIGSFYTPKIIADFLVSRLSDKLGSKTTLSILEPSAGDGVFLHSIIENESLSRKVNQIIAVEREESEVKKIQNAIKDNRVKIINADFLNYQKGNRQKFSLVIGNPPYIKKSFLELNQIELSKEIHRNASLANNEIKNIWTAFLVRSIEFVKDDGLLSFVLPAELLQVKYAAELRALLQKHFERVEIFTFNELLFKETNAKGQDTVLLIAEKKARQQGVYYCNINRVSELKENRFILTSNIGIKDSKWTHYHLGSDEIELLKKFESQLSPINNYCNSKAGIVTAANDYFIINQSVVEEYSLHNFIKPIIQKGFFVNGSVVINRKDFNELVRNEKPTFLLALNKNSYFRKNQKINQYLELGENLELGKRYKMTKREKWYEVPNIGKPAEAFFFKRCDEYPKLIKNKAKLLVTDSAYVIEMKNGYEIEDLIFSFYNSLSLSFAELNGRSYGGGVLELTPNEFKGLPVPFTKINTKKFDSFVTKFKAKNSIKDICKLNDVAILKSFDKSIDSDTIEKLFNIREKLYLRRIKSN